MQIIFVIVLMLGLAFSLPVDQRRTNGVVDEPDASPRFRRRVGNLNITSTLEQYVRDLYEEYASESGYGADKPTDVWCFADKGEISLLLCISALFYHSMVTNVLCIMVLHPSPHRCCPGTLPSKASKERKV